MTKFTALVPALIFAAIAAGLGLSLTNDPHKMPSMLIDKPPPKFELPAVDGTGKPLSSGALKGEIMLLNVYASWCPGCRVEHPTLMKLAAAKTIPLYGLNWKDKPREGGRIRYRHAGPVTEDVWHNVFEPLLANLRTGP